MRERKRAEREKRWEEKREREEASESEREGRERDRGRRCSSRRYHRSSLPLTTINCEVCECPRTKHSQHRRSGSAEQLDERLDTCDTDNLPKRFYAKLKYESLKKRKEKEQKHALCGHVNDNPERSFYVK